MWWRSGSKSRICVEPDGESVLDIYHTLYKKKMFSLATAIGPVIMHLPPDRKVVLENKWEAVKK